jgi:hypothetical protein
MNAMATQTIITCDVHGDGITPATTVSFGLDGASYEIELCEPHASELRGMLARYAELAREGDERGSGRRRSSRGSGGSDRAGRRTDLSEIREWARREGYDVSDRGRIPGAIIEEFDAQASKGGGRRRR